MSKLLGFAAAILVITAAAIAQNDSHSLRIQADDQSFGVSSGKADSKALGVAIYPGAKPEHTGDQEGANLHLDFGSDAMHLIVEKYSTPDSPDRVVDFYKKQLARYGTVLECRNGKAVGPTPTGLECESDHDSNNIELKSGTKHKQHIVGVTPKDGSTEFGIVYLESEHRGEI